MIAVLLFPCQVLQGQELTSVCSYSKVKAVLLIRPCRSTSLCTTSPTIVTIG